MYIKEAFESEIPDLKVDKSFYKKILTIEAEFVNKDSDHIEFFGGSLMGVHTVRFKPEDRDRIFSELIDTHEATIEDLLYNLKDENGNLVITTANRIVSSDIFNITTIWLIYKVNESRYLTDKEKHEAKVSLCMYMLYRFYTSLCTNRFRYPADEDIARATYDTLSNKFIIKQMGTWWKTFRYLAENAINDNGIHGKFLRNIEDDNYFVNILNDIQGRIRSMVNNIYEVHIRIRDTGNKYSTSSMLVEIDGKIILKDKNKSLENYIRYIKKIIPDKNSFIKPELVSVVTNILGSLPEKHLINLLEWCSSNYGYSGSNIIDNSIDAIMEHSFDYLSEDKTLLHDKNNVQELVTKLRGTYMSSKAKNELVVKARDISTELVKISTKTKNVSTIAAIRTGYMIYIIIRAFSMKHYSN